MTCNSQLEVGEKQTEKKLRDGPGSGNLENHHIVYDGI